MKQKFALLFTKISILVSTFLFLPACDELDTLNILSGAHLSVDDNLVIMSAMLATIKIIEASIVHD